MELIIDGSLIRDKEALFKESIKQLDGADYAGHNLDALYDILTEQPKEIEVQILAPKMVRKAVGAEYYHRLLDMLEDCCSKIVIEP
ncbi:MAG: barstar family protein [Eubacterium sp.]|nr:barstar family protein [Eubacterium sp.]